MNSLKNLVMMAMLLAISYGAYVIVHQPVTALPTTSEDFGDSGQHSQAVEPAPPVVELHPTAPQPGGGPLRSQGEDAMAKADRDSPPGSPTDNGLSEESPSPYPTVPEFRGIAERYSGSTEPPAEGVASDEANGSTPAETQAVPNPNFEDVWQGVQAKLAEHRLGEALLLLSTWYYEPTLSPEQNRRLVELLDQLAGTVVYSRQSILEPPYRVQPGDTLESIAQRHQVTAELLGRINGIDPQGPLTPGEEIKVLRGPFDAEISRERSEMTLFLGRYYAGRFHVALGRNFPAGEGDYEVAERTLGHDFFDPRTGRAIQGADPENPFGQYWIGLRGSQITAGDNIGIHAQNPATPDAGTGGIVLSEEQVADLHAILSVGSQVRVYR